jgi:hypothetical protein
MKIDLQGYVLQSLQDLDVLAATMQHVAFRKHLSDDEHESTTRALGLMAEDLQARIHELQAACAGE